MVGKSEETVSVLIPIYNEEGNLPLLYEKLDAALQRIGRACEIIFADDGSSYGSMKILLDLREKR